MPEENITQGLSSLSRELREDIEIERNVLEALLRFQAYAPEAARASRNALLQIAIHRTKGRLDALCGELTRRALRRMTRAQTQIIARSGGAIIYNWGGGKDNETLG